MDEKQTDSVWKKLKELEAEKNKACPSCGRCPHCGRGGLAYPTPYAPMPMPAPTNPWWWHQTWMTTDNQTQRG